MLRLHLAGLEIWDLHLTLPKRKPERITGLLGPSRTSVLRHAPLTCPELKEADLSFDQAALVGTLLTKWVVELEDVIFPVADWADVI
jgi:hypothetical protein